MHTHTHTYTHTHIYIYIYIYSDKKTDKERHVDTGSFENQI